MGKLFSPLELVEHLVEEILEVAGVLLHAEQRAVQPSAPHAGPDHSSTEIKVVVLLRVQRIGNYRFGRQCINFGQCCGSGGPTKMQNRLDPDFYGGPGNFGECS